MTRSILTLGLSALVLGSSVSGCVVQSRSMTAAASKSGDAQATKAAAKAAKRAQQALAKQDAAAAVTFAEEAVGLRPRDAGYRLVLAQSYLKTGRFVAARAAFADVLALDPDNGRAALNLALATIAGGDWLAARGVLAEHAARIPAADHGLALALAGDPVGAVTMLTAAAREPGAGAQVRQNLALALALAGNWQMARVVAATDLSPADVDTRMQQWADFAQPHGAADQVATLLGVTAVADAGQPLTLALHAPAPPQLAEEVSAEQIAEVPLQPATPATRPPAIVFAAPREVVQTLHGNIRAGRERVVPRRAEPATGEWYAQLGAYRSAEGAREAWARIAQRLARIGEHAPRSTTFRSENGEVYRLSVGGFARADAEGLCRRLKIAGGDCFVRRQAGNRVAAWARGGIMLAAR